MSIHEASPGKVAELVRAHLGELVGLPLSTARRAADMRMFQFGVIRPVEGGTGGEFAVHVQCAWRIEGSEGIVTGRSDLWEPEEVAADFNWDAWQYDQGNLQDARMAAWLGGHDSQTRSYINQTGSLVVEGVEADGCGGATLSLTGGYQLVLFPAGSAGEDWRIFRPCSDEDHFVIRGGVVELSESDETVPAGDG